MLTFFGKGSAFSEGINSSAYTYNFEDKSLFIIDVGENTFQTIKSFIDKQLVDKVSIFITHMHSDHVGGLSTLIYYLHYIKGIRPTIMTGKMITEKLRDFLKLLMHSKSQYLLFTATDQIFTGINRSISILPVETTHTPHHASYGLMINEENSKYAYFSGDSRTLPDLIKNKIDIIDIFYQDITTLHYEGNVHMSYEVFLQEYPIDAISKVVPYHHSDKQNEEIVEKINKLLQQNVIDDLFLQF